MGGNGKAMSMVLRVFPVAGSNSKIFLALSCQVWSLPLRKAMPVGFMPAAVGPTSVPTPEIGRASCRERAKITPDSVGAHEGGGGGGGGGGSWKAMPQTWVKPMLPTSVAVPVVVAEVS